MISDKRMELHIPLVKTCISAARLVASVAAEQLGLSVVQSEDVKLCVTEACNILTLQKIDEANLVFTFEKDLVVEIIGIEKDGMIVPYDTEMSMIILTEFSSSCELYKNEAGCIDRFRLVFTVGE
ncbi:MAG: hypothetical protein IJF71_03880 [Clostridia bacterium]|nr:hypothetical protein [Clostridia bacterium]